MSLIQVVLLAAVQGLAELLPVSSSAHVIVAEKLLGLDPSSPPMTLLLVMLHTGTMVAVIVYFWPQWRAAFFGSAAVFRRFAVQVAVATALTGVVGFGLMKVIGHTLLRGRPHAEVEELFSRLDLIAPALAAAGVVILLAAFAERRRSAATAGTSAAATAGDGLTTQRAAVIGAVQGLCLPFRGFSRSGATISAGMLLGVAKLRAEAFSFALAVVLTPPVVAREALRLAKAVRGDGTASLAQAAVPSLLGAVVAVLAGLVALRWLSRWLERGRWHWFGIYCLAAAAAVTLLHRAGY